MTKMNKELGRVRSIRVEREGHGILTFMVDLDFGGTGQGFGGYALDTYDKIKKKRVGTAFGTDVILSLLDLFGVERLGDAVGKTVYAHRDGTGFSSKIVALEMPPFDGGRRFDIRELIADHHPERVS